VPLFQEQLLKMAMVVAGFSGGEAEELRRAMGFKRSEKRMREIEAKLRAGMTRNGILQKSQEEIVLSITSFALYGFPESHAASFALIAYASAYLKQHYLAAFTAALLNNQPMGFYSPATIVKDAQRHGLKVFPVDVTKSEWECTLEAISCQPSAIRKAAARRSSAVGRNGRTAVDRLFVIGEAAERQQNPAHGVARRSMTNDRRRNLALRVGLRYVRGLHEKAGRVIVGERKKAPFSSIHDLARRVPELRKNDLNTLAAIGALNSIPLQNSDCRLQITDRALKSEIYNLKSEIFFHRRDALWNAAAVANPAGPLLETIPGLDNQSPLTMMTDEERLVADFRGTGMTVGPHPMAYHRDRMKKLGVCTAIELAQLPSDKKVRTAGGVIARQRPGTAKGFVFLSLEDETGVSNAIINPDLFQQNRLLLSSEQFLLIEGVLQNQDGVMSIKATRVEPIGITEAQTISHDFH
jgi:error-prone DNA polymerase